MTLFLVSLLAVSDFVAIHLLSPALRVLDGVPRNRLLSAAGGLAIAFIFLRILLELGDSQQVFEAAARGTLLGLLGNHVYLIALVSLVLFYAVERLVQTSRAQQRAVTGHDAPSEGVLWIHLSTSALDNFVIASLLTHWADTRGVLSLGLFLIALALEFVVNDHSLHAEHQANYDRRGRWLPSLAGAWGSSPTSLSLPPRPWRRFWPARPC